MADLSFRRKMHRSKETHPRRICHRSFRTSVRMDVKRKCEFYFNGNAYVVRHVVGMHWCCRISSNRSWMHFNGHFVRLVDVYLRDAFHRIYLEQFCNEYLRECFNLPIHWFSNNFLLLLVFFLRIPSLLPPPPTHLRNILDIIFHAWWLLSTGMDFKGHLISVWHVSEM